jgi:hypothetical protein
MVRMSCSEVRITAAVKLVVVSPMNLAYLCEHIRIICLCGAACTPQC